MLPSHRTALATFSSANYLTLYLHSNQTGTNETILDHEHSLLIGCFGLPGGWSKTLHIGVSHGV